MADIEAIPSGWLKRGWLRNPPHSTELNGGSSSQPADSQRVVNDPITVAIYPLVNIQKAIEMK